MSEHMTGAELQTLREACGLTRDELGALAGVQARTVKHWENGHSAGVPADVADVVRRLDAQLSSACNEGLQVLVAQAARKSWRAPVDVVLMRYASAEDLARYRADMAGMPAGVHGALVSRLRLMVPTLPGFAGVAVRIVWMRSDDYEVWRQANVAPDSEATRDHWAELQVDKQAAAHKADQPPAGAAGLSTTGDL
jgi:DNA-binding XRE family transcriptional regulator